MDRGDAARIEPIAGEIERRTIAILKPQYIAVKIPGAFEIRRFDRVMPAGQGAPVRPIVTNFFRFWTLGLPVMGIPARLIEEKRKHQRTEINEPAYVSAGGSVMRCTVRNISPDGAAIDVDNPAFVPNQFRLVMASDSSTHDCRVIWIHKSGSAWRL